MYTKFLSFNKTNGIIQNTLKLASLNNEIFLIKYSKYSKSNIFNDLSLI